MRKKVFGLVLLFALTFATATQAIAECSGPTCDEICIAGSVCNEMCGNARYCSMWYGYQYHSGGGGSCGSYICAHYFCTAERMYPTSANNSRSVLKCPRCSKP